MKNRNPTYFTSIETCVDHVINIIGKKIVFYAPLAIGKPTHFINALYKRVKQDSSLNVTLMTCIPLQTPKAKGDLEKRLLEPVIKRAYNGHVNLDFVNDAKEGKTPDNFTVIDFYMIPGAMLDQPKAQQNFLMSNFTHVVSDTLDYDINLVGQAVASKDADGRTNYSVSSNPDVALQFNKLVRQKQKDGKKALTLAQVNNKLPFMYGDAVMEADDFDVIIDSPEYHFDLFGIPSEVINLRDHMIGLYTSALIRDGGTLQVGIGSLGDSVGNALKIRHENNDEYHEIVADLAMEEKFGRIIDKCSDSRNRFVKGLYGSTEMFGYGYIQLYEAGVLKRKVYDDILLQQLVLEGKIGDTITAESIDVLLENNLINTRITEKDFRFLCRYGFVKDGLLFEDNEFNDNGQRISADLSDITSKKHFLSRCLGNSLKGGIILHASFFHGPKAFYDCLKKMPDEEKKKISMTDVGYTNQLYGNEELKKLQRQSPRFVNSAIMVSLLGAVNSESLEDGRVISGIGGQFNFVSMSREIEDGRSIILVRATRESNGKVSSNIVFNYGNVSVPRHYRDIVVSEYGIADLRGKVDKDVIAEMLNITDSRFQEQLLAKAKSVGKIPQDYEIPTVFRDNYPQALERKLKRYRKSGLLKDYPFGSLFTEEEAFLAKSLINLKKEMTGGKLVTALRLVATLFRSTPHELTPYLKRMQLAEPGSIKEKLQRKIIQLALQRSMQADS